MFETGRLFISFENEEIKYLIPYVCIANLQNSIVKRELFYTIIYKKYH